MANEQIVDTREDKQDEDAFIIEAKQRLRDAGTYEAINRIAGTDDLEFLNGIHWDAKDKKRREADGRPCLTINKLPVFVDQVVGDSRLNQMAIKIRPAGGGATKEVAEILDGLIRQIQRVSKAEIAAQTALE